MRDFSFEQKQSTFMDKFIAKLRYSYILNKLNKNNINLNSKNICDVWCWFNANFLKYLANLYSWSKYYWVDLEINNYFDFFHFVKANLELDKFNIEDNSMDIVFSLAVIEHLSNPSLYLSEIKRILKPWWSLIITTPSIYWKPVLEFLAYTWIWTKEEILDHKIYYSKTTLATLIWKYFTNFKINYFQFWMNIFLLINK